MLVCGLVRDLPPRLHCDMTRGAQMQVATADAGKACRVKQNRHRFLPREGTVGLARQPTRTPGALAVV